MRLLPFKTFPLTYLEYREEYISIYGREKFNKAFDAILNFNKTILLFQASEKNKRPPRGNEFFGLVFLIPYFIFAKNDTRAIGSIIALYLWDEKINQKFKMSDGNYFRSTIEEIFSCLRMN